MNNKILILGDLHGEFGILNQLINKHNPYAVIVCGDFGYWPKMHIELREYSKHYVRESDFNINVIKNHNTKVYWIPGNHEHWDDLESKFYRNSINPIEMEAWSNIFYCPIGSVIRIQDKNILCVGGADSQDKKYRVAGESWFPQENLTFDDYKFIVNNIKGIKIDAVVSHTCPRSFAVKRDYPEKWSDPNRLILDQILFTYKPDNWFFGHWHHFEAGQHENTKWQMLDHSTSRNRWWVEYN